MEQVQLTLEELYHKRGNYIQTVLRDSNIQDHLGELDHTFGLDLLAHLCQHKRANIPTMVGLLRHHYPTAQDVADQIALAVQIGIVGFDGERLITCVELTPEEQSVIDKWQYPPPCVVTPQKLTCNTDTPYLLKHKGSVILNNNHHEGDVCLDHLNHVNKYSLSINEEVMVMVQNKWANLDKQKDGETSVDFAKRVRAFNKYDKSARSLMTLLLDCGNKFFMTHSYDKRGRVYCNGYHVSYQGNPWNKAVIEFTNKELIKE